MAKLTIEIDMDDPQKTWDDLYRRIEELGDEPVDDSPRKPMPATIPLTYDLLLDFDGAFGEVADFFVAFSGRD